jgi:acyl-CoA thioester hydrolase
MSNRFEMRFTAAAEHIDFNGHVNNMVWLQWVQDIAGAHWDADAPPEYRDLYAWFVLRHEIDYRGNIALGETVTATTTIPEPPSGARFVRCVSFADQNGKEIVGVRSTWAMIDKANGKVKRVPAGVSAPFLAD